MKLNLIPLAIITLWVNHISAQHDNKDSVKASRSLTDPTQQKVSVVDTPDEFVIKKPSSNDAKYGDFLNFLYRNDKAKSRATREIARSLQENDVTRGKRMIVFRPLFVYKKQEIKRQRVAEQKKKTKKPTPKPAKPSRG